MIDSPVVAIILVMCSSYKRIRWWTKLRMKVRLNRGSTWSGNGKMLNRRVEES